jgi:GMP synthase (glutamine-hydrolysing)
MRPLLIIKCGSKLAALTNQPGDFEQWIADGMGWPQARRQIINVAGGETLPVPKAVCAVVITGSGAMITDRSPWIEQTGSWLRSAGLLNLPMLGICFGHQLLADAFGGVVDDNPNGVEVGTVSSRLTTEGKGNPLFEGLPDALLVQASHRQAVLELPAGAVRLASSDLDRNHAFALGSNCWGVQFHPEFNAAMMPHYIDYYRQTDHALAGFPPQDTPVSRQLLRRFGQLVTEGETTRQ